MRGPETPGLWKFCSGSQRPTRLRSALPGPTIASAAPGGRGPRSSPGLCALCAPCVTSSARFGL
eukprot:4291817-Lingulodinium_polyedra.AAC.1